MTRRRIWIDRAADYGRMLLLAALIAANVIGG